MRSPFYALPIIVRFFVARFFLFQVQSSVYHRQRGDSQEFPLCVLLHYYCQKIQLKTIVHQLPHLSNVILTLSHGLCTVCSATFFFIFSSHVSLICDQECISRRQFCQVQDNRVLSAIKSKLEGTLKPVYIQVFNESYMHNVPKGSETHFKVLVVSEEFEGMPLIKRHRLVMDSLKEQFTNGVHALSIQAKTPKQWKESSVVTESPPCLGGSQR